LLTQPAWPSQPDRSFYRGDRTSQYAHTQSPEFVECSVKSLYRSERPCKAAFARHKLLSSPASLADWISTDPRDEDSRRKCGLFSGLRRIPVECRITLY
jgi:hypothetical protein